MSLRQDAFFHIAMVYWAQSAQNQKAEAEEETGTDPSRESIETAEPGTTPSES